MAEMFQPIDHYRRRFLTSGAMALAGAPFAALDVLTASAAKASPTLKTEGTLPKLNGAIGWLNSPALSRESLRGKVVLVDFWTYTCINSLRPLPYIKRWAEKYKAAGLVVIGVHTPEFSFEKEPANVKNAVRDLKVAYPVAIDSDYRIWQAFNNEYWPAEYLVDGQGRIRYHHFGEGEYDESERVINALLKENGATGIDPSLARVTPEGIEAAPSEDIRSPETYVGHGRGEQFASPERLARDSRTTYSPPTKLALNHWALSGAWKVGEEGAVLETAPGSIAVTYTWCWRPRRMVRPFASR